MRLVPFAGQPHSDADAARGLRRLPGEAQDAQSPGGRAIVAAALAMAMVATSVNGYTLFQLRQVATLSVELVSSRYPAIESAKWLLTSLYAQLMSEKKYEAVKDPGFIMDFDEEAEDFRRTLAALRTQEDTVEGRDLLAETERLYESYRRAARLHMDRQVGLTARQMTDFGMRRDALIDQIAHRLQAYVGLHERWVGTGVRDLRERITRAESLMRYVAIVMALLSLGVVGLAGFHAGRVRRRTWKTSNRNESRGAGWAVQSDVGTERESLDRDPALVPSQGWRKAR